MHVNIFQRNGQATKRNDTHRIDLYENNLREHTVR